MPIDITITQYLNDFEGWPLIDVRSPGEFDKGHIPGAVNIELFSNDERAHVGTVYKQQSQKAAIELGYQYVNPKLQSFIDRSKVIAPKKKGSGSLLEGRNAKSCLCTTPERQWIYRSVCY